MRRAAASVATAICMLAFPIRSVAQNEQPSTVADRSRARITGTLTLDEVLRSASESHPQIEGALARIDTAEGRSLEADGGFDPKARLGLSGLPVGEYTKGQMHALIVQESPLWGARFHAGWRRGFGNFAVYDGDLETLNGGEFRAGVDLPLWRGGPIDRRRADIAQADAGIDQTREALEATRLVLANAAASAYWSWVETGRQLTINEQLLEVAQQRVRGIERQIEAGSLEPLVAIDNQRTVLDRQTKVIDARRKLAQAAIKLSLFLRTPDGTPIRAGRDQLPPAFPEPEPPTIAALERDIRFAREQRPDLIALRHLARQASIELDLADTNVSPQVDLRAWVAQDVGSGRPELEPLDIGLGVTVEIPLLLRQDRGKYRQARGKLSELKAELRLAGDKIEAEVRSAYAALEAAYETVELASNARIANERLATAERRRLELGQSDILIVNLRELAAASAAAAEASALAEYHRARASYVTAAGRAPR